jgi:hypothetical protein
MIRTTCISPTSRVLTTSPGHTKRTGKPGQELTR